MDLQRPDIIRLDDDDIRTGIALEIEAAKAQARLQAILEMSRAFAAQLREKYGAPEGHELVDWLIGFQPAQKE